MSSKNAVPNYYKLLGVPEYAHARRIKDAYAAAKYKARLELDPDRPDPAVEAQIRAIEAALLTLTDDRKREEYDQWLAKNEDVADARERTAKYSGAASTLELVYREGLAHMQAGRLDLATVSFRKILQQDKNNPRLLKLLAKSYRSAGETKFAAQTIEQAVEFEPDDWENYFILGRLLEHQNNLIGARRCYRRAYELNQKNPHIVAQFARGSLVWERMVRNVKAAFKLFLPDPRAKTLRLHDGLVTRRMALQTVQAAVKRLRPQPSRYTFRYLGVI